MAGYFKKRRGPSGPSKNELKARRSRDSGPGDTLGGLFPTVRQLTIRLEFTTPEGHPFGSSSRALGPADPCDLSVPCPGRCGTGSFNLATKVGAVVEAKELLSESSGTCQEPLYAGAASVCGLQLRCRLEAAYLPAEETTPG